MSRGLGLPLALSIVAHGGAVTALALLGTAWLAGSPAVPAAPPALYVDLVHPIVTSDRHVTHDGAPPMTGAAAQPRLPASVPRAAVRAPAPEPPGPTAVMADTPPVNPAPPRVEPEVPRPPVVPRLPTQIAVSAPPLPAVAPETHEPPPVSSSPRTEDFARCALIATRPSDAGDDRAPRPSGGDGAQPSGVSGAQPGPDPGGAAHVLGTGSGASPSGSGNPTNASDTAGAGTALARLSPGRQGSGDAPDGGVPPEYESYVRALRQRIQARLVYPWAAVRRVQQGVVELELRVGADGRLVAVEVVAGASADSLRTAAVTAVRGSAPFPFPAGLAGRQLVIRLPVEFRLR